MNKLQFRTLLENYLTGPAYAKVEIDTRHPDHFKTTLPDGSVFWVTVSEQKPGETQEDGE